jgi:hypothetical protein
VHTTSPTWIRVLHGSQVGWAPPGSAAVLAAYGVPTDTPTSVMLGSTPSTNPWLLAQRLTDALSGSSGTVWTTWAAPGGLIIDPAVPGHLTASWHTWQALWRHAGVHHLTVLPVATSVRVTTGGNGTRFTLGVLPGTGVLPSNGAVWWQATVTLAAGGRGPGGIVGTEWRARLTLVRVTTGWHLARWQWMQTPPVVAG